MQFLCRCAGDVQPQQEAEVTKFKLLHSGPPSSYPTAVSRFIVGARAVFLWLHGKFGDLERWLERAKGTLSGTRRW